jgi:hypothetical protein
VRDKLVDLDISGRILVKLMLSKYRGADKSLAQQGKKEATATEDFDVHISYLLS